MARTKQAAPLQREPSSEYTSKHDRRPANGALATNGDTRRDTKPAVPARDTAPGIREAAIAIAGIWGSFLTWGYLQEKLTTTPYGPPANPEVFRFPVFLNTIQSAFGALMGIAYLYISSDGAPRPIFPSRQILLPLALVAITSSLASPFGYAALAHIDFITYILAKSCKLLPVMALNLTIFRRSYPKYKYGVVLAVTFGVAIFTLHTGKRKTRAHSGQTAWGILLLAINLLFDGLTNSVQDWVFESHRGYTGPQMMCANNILQTVVTGLYLVLSPWLAHTAVGRWVGVDAVGGDGAGEMSAALGFMARHPGVWVDVLGFAACGAFGQVFIFYALATFSSVFLVTVTVTRKMVTMMLSVVAFGHTLSQMQWLGVGLVFGGIGVEAQISRREKMAKAAAKANKEKKGQ